MKWYKVLVAGLVFTGILPFYWLYLTSTLPENQQPEHVSDRNDWTEIPGGACHTKRPDPGMKISQVVHEYINQIRNCPCNVNFVNETNPLCATTDTLEHVSRRTNISFVPETLAPCVFVYKDMDNYELAVGNTGRNHQWFLKKPSFLNRILYCLPSVFLLGVAKCGTTNLHVSLAQHQKLKQTQRKEMSFWGGGGSWERESFLDDYNHTRYNLFAYMSLASDISKRISKRIYLELRAEMNDTDRVLDDTLIIDSDPGNVKEENLKKLTTFIPGVKCILILREPADRLFSYYRFSGQHLTRTNLSEFEDQTPEGFHRYVTKSLNTKRSGAFPTSVYTTKVRYTLDMLPAGNVILIQFEEFVKDPIGVIETQILPVLGLEPFSEEKKAVILNKNKTNPSKYQYKMLAETRQLLQNHFRKHNHELSSMLKDPKWTWGY